MALVSQGWRLVVRMKDSGDNNFTRRVEYTAADATEAAVRANNFITTLAAITGCVIFAHYHYELYEETSFVFPVGVEGEEQGRMIYQVAGSPSKKASFDVPGIIEAAMVGVSGPDRNVMNTGYGPSQNFAAQFTSGDFLLSDGETMSSWLSGKRVTQRSNKG